MFLMAVFDRMVKVLGRNFTVQVNTSKFQLGLSYGQVQFLNFVVSSAKHIFLPWVAVVVGWPDYPCQDLSKSVFSHRVDACMVFTDSKYRNMLDGACLTRYCHCLSVWRHCECGSDAPASLVITIAFQYDVSVAGPLMTSHHSNTLANQLYVQNLTQFQQVSAQPSLGTSRLCLAQ